jgi:aerobic carbon-monoxide dehydrogenase small subunit
MIAIALTVNGRAIERSVPDNRLLVDLLREDLALTGTHVGCDTSQCGACVVHVDGRSVKSCALFAAEANGTAVTTIEGLGGEHPLQRAFQECHGLQCGFCTPGMIMSAADLLKQHPSATDSEIRHWLEGNLCRCTGYQNIIAAVKRAAEMMGARP